MSRFLKNLQRARERERVEACSDYAKPGMILRGESCMHVKQEDRNIYAQEVLQFGWSPANYFALRVHPFRSWLIL
jgi:hypothetical protein